MHVANELRRAEIEGIEALVDEDALGVQHRAHGAVTDENSALKSLDEGLHEEIGKLVSW